MDPNIKLTSRMLVVDMIYNVVVVLMSPSTQIYIPGREDWYVHEINKLWRYELNQQNMSKYCSGQIFKG